MEETFFLQVADYLFAETLDICPISVGNENIDISAGGSSSAEGPACLDTEALIFVLYNLIRPFSKCVQKLFDLCPRYSLQEMLIVLESNLLHGGEHIWVLAKVLNGPEALIVELLGTLGSETPNSLKSLDCFGFRIRIYKLESFDCPVCNKLSNLLYDTLTQALATLKLLS